LGLPWCGSAVALSAGAAPSSSSSWAARAIPREQAACSVAGKLAGWFGEHGQ